MTRSSNAQWAFVVAVAVFFLILDVTYVLNSSSPQSHAMYEEDLMIDESTAPHRRLMEKKKDGHVEFDESDPHLALFQLSNYTVLGPTHFPEPTRIVQQALQGKNTRPKVEVAPILKPRLGQHRAEQDAVFLFASEYDLAVYQGFILSLRKTGYEGDIVLAVSPKDLNREGTEPTERQARLHEFFASDPHVIAYVVPFVCYNAEGEAVDSAKGGIRTCHCHVLYGSRNVTEANPERKIEYSATEWAPLPDFRSERPVATTRYELYWLWSVQYQPHTWQMLVDARDTYFQTDPFAAVPREPDLKRPNGVIFFFGENSDATRIGSSDKNRKWLTNAYGNKVIEAMQDKPTICSGATMGEQIALETYLRAMVNEYDETGIKLMGADQGFHNYLYYSGKLRNAHKIRSLSVFDQGRGIVNNMGAMRNKELHEWGNGKMVVEEGEEKVILNWDGKPSPVVHQFDRFDVLGKYFYKKKTKELKDAWYQENRNRKKAQAAEK